MESILMHLTPQLRAGGGREVPDWQPAVEALGGVTLSRLGLSICRKDMMFVPC